MAEPAREHYSPVRDCGLQLQALLSLRLCVVEGELVEGLEVVGVAKVAVQEVHALPQFVDGVATEMKKNMILGKPKGAAS